MKQDEEPSDGSIFNAWKVFSKLYNAVYCSRGKDPECTTQVTRPKEDSSKNLDQDLDNSESECDKHSVQDVAEAVEEGEAQNHDEKNDLERSAVSWFDAVKEQQIEKVKEYIAEGVNLNDADELGWSALHIAAWNDYVDICKQLLASDANVNLAGPGSSSPLSLAAQRGHTSIVELLLQSRCDVSQTASLGDSLNVTALHLAAQHGHSAVVNLLIEAGATVNAMMTVRGINGITPLHLAVQNEHLEVMDILIAAGCDVHSSTQPQTPPEGSTDEMVTQEDTSQSDEQNTMESSC